MLRTEIPAFAGMTIRGLGYPKCDCPGIMVIRIAVQVQVIVGAGFKPALFIFAFPVHPEPVEGPSDHGSTSSPRTDCTVKVGESRDSGFSNLPFCPKETAPANIGGG